MCNCIKRIEEQLNEKMIERFPGFEIEEEVKFVNKSLVFSDDGKTALILGNPVLGKMRRGKQVRKFETQMMPSYCPFCGEKIKKD